jgi:hypothetical protein
MPVKLSGAPKLRLALTKYPTKLDKETQKNLRKVLNHVVSNAKGFLPSNDQMLSGWTGETSSADTIKYRAFPKYDQGKAIRGIKASTTGSKPNRKGWSSLVSIVNASAGGAIYETAGRKNPQGAPHQETTRGTFSSYIDTSNKVSKSLNKNAGKQFIDRMNQYGKLVNARETGKVGRATRKLTGRVIFRAWAEDEGRANAAVIKAVEAANKTLETGVVNG